MKELHVAVTGASGHIGNNICRSLLKSGYHVKALIHTNSNSLEGLEVEKIRGNILDSSTLSKLVEGCQIVIHAAGKISVNGDPDGSLFQVNVEGTKNVIDACLETGVDRLIYISSINALQQSAESDIDENSSFVEPTQGFLHDLAKSAAEKEVFKGFCQGLDCVILNPTAVIGPYDFQPSLMGKALLALYSRKIPALVAGGFDFVDVRDVADAIVQSIHQGRSGERYLLSGIWKTVREVSLLVQEITGAAAPKFTSPPWLARMSVPLVKAYSLLTSSPMLYTRETLDVLLRCSRNISSSKAKRELSFFPRPFATTLRETFKWFEEASFLCNL